MRHVARVVSPALCLVLVVLVATSCRRQETAPAPAEAPAQAESALPSSAVTAESLRPILSVDGSAHRLPTSLVIQFARSVTLALDDNGLPTDDTWVEFEPAVPGRLDVSGPSTLTFTPQDGLAPDTEYRARLRSVAPVGQDVLKPEGGDDWSLTFNTPTFAFDRSELVEFTAATGKGAVELTFTGPVDAADVGSHARLRRAGVTLTAGFTTIDGRPQVVLASFTKKGLTSGEELSLELRPGIRLASKRRAAAAQATTTFTLQESPLAGSVAMLDAGAVEGTNGFYVELVCNDASVPEKHWYWDPGLRQGYGQISRRCSLDPAGLSEALSFDPPVAFTTAPSGGGVRVFGDFQRGSYALRLRGGVRTSDGGILRTSYESTVWVAARNSRISFVSKGRYLPRDQWQSIPFRHLNVDAVDVTVRHVRPENLVFWASADGESASGRDSEPLAQTRLAVKGDPDVLTTSWLDAAALVPRATRGLVEVTLSAGEVHDTARIVLTDLQLVVKRAASPPGPAPSTPPVPGARPAPPPQGGDVRAWVFDAESLQPVSAVKVDLVRPSGQVVATGLTTATGEVTLPVRPANLDQEPPFALVARKGDDVTYLAFDEVETNVAEEHVGGEEWGQAPPWRAALTTERGVYRPGETAHVIGLVRSGSYEPAPVGMPVTLKVVDPRGLVVKQVPLLVDDVGFVTFDVRFADFATTGRHEVQLDVGDTRIATHRFHVEEFVPERMEVKVEPRSGATLVGDPVSVTASARYLFGGVPADHRAELTCVAESAEFKPAANAGYAYGTWHEEGAAPRSVPLGTASGTLDAEGRTDLACPTSGAPGLAGPQRVVASVAVFEAGSGRTTIGQAEIPIHPELHVIGLASRTEEARAGEPLRIEGIVVDWQGQPLADAPAVHVELVRLEREYGWWYDQATGQTNYRHSVRPSLEGGLDVTPSGGKFQAELVPRQDGAAYLVRATAGRARTELRVPGRFDDDWWDEWDPGRDVDKTPRPGRPSWLTLKAPVLARVGETVEVSLQAPYRGRLLWTVEAEGVIERAWQDVTAGPATWSFRLGTFRPNVHVTALLLKPPHLESAESFVPDRAYGVLSIPIEPTEHLLPVKLTVPAESRSGQPLTISVDLGPQAGPARVALSAVDEGILSLTKFKTPDPAAQVFTRRALGVKTYETVGWTLLAAPPPATGAGSGDAALALGRVQSITPVSLWAGVLDVPRSGRLDITLDVPTWRGALRVMAMAATPSRMGSAEARVVVRDPLTLQVTLPRFLAAGDVAAVPVFVTNATTGRLAVDIELSATDADAGGATPEPGVTGSALVEVVSAPGRLDLAPGESGTALFTLRSQASAGAVKLTALARSGDLSSSESLVVPLLPTGPRTRRVQRIPLEAGTTDLTAQLAGWEPLSERTVVRVTANPLADVFAHLGHLVDYPHGCLEQVSSRTRILLALQDRIGDVDPELLRKGGVEPMVRAGIERILSMQTPSGAFGYWPGASDPAYWATANATDLLMDARAAGYQVPQDRIDASLTWMEERVTNHFEKGRGNDDWYSSDAEPRFHHVLARAQRGRPARAEALLARVPGSSEGERAENRFLLQAALYLSGDRRFERELRSVDVTPATKERSRGWSFYSDRRRRGLILTLRTDLFGVDEAGQRLGNVVADGLRGEASRWYTTQELVWGLTGLSRLLGASATFSPPVLRANGRVVEPALPPTGSKSPDRSWSLTRASELGRLEVEVAEKGEGQLFAILSSDGILKGAVAPVGEAGLRVSRTFVDAAGLPVDVAASAPALGEVVNVVLTLSNTTGERVTNIALVDRIPAGWEIENPRLGRRTDLPWIVQDELWNFDHLDLRDDRLEAFGVMEAGTTRKVVYAARAVTAGRFVLPPVEAEAMYDPSIWARSPGGRVTVTGPWAPVSQ